MRIFTILILSLLVSSCGENLMDQSYSEVDSDSGIFGERYSQILADLRGLSTKYPTNSKLVSYGKSVRNKDLTLIRISESKEIEGAPAVLISGVTHGNEYLKIADRFPKWLLENKDKSSSLSQFLDIGGVIYVAPVVNPDGYDSRRRGNANGQDLNRDYDILPLNELRFRQKETSQLVDYLNKDIEGAKLKLRVTMDYHCCNGSLLYPWSYSKGAKLPKKDQEAHVEIGKIMQDSFGTSYRYGTTAQLLGYAPKGTSKDYYYAKHGSLSFTFEGRHRSEDQNFSKHTKMWEDIFKKITIEQNRADIYLKIASDTSIDQNSSQLKFNVSSQGAASIELCLGTSCEESNVAVSYSQSIQQGGVKIFHDSKEVNISNDQIITLVAKDASGRAIRSRSIQFKIK